MKIKSLSFILAVAFLILLCSSCLTVMPYETSSHMGLEGESTRDADYETTYPPATLPIVPNTTTYREPYSPTVIQEDDLASYKSDHGCVDMGDFVIFNYSGEMQFYNKQTGTFHRFCYDRMCDHKNWQQCISLRFVMDGVLGLQMLQYSNYNDRFYYLRGEQLCSFATDGSDFRIEYSFGNEGNLNRYVYSIYSVIYLSIYGKYAYMIQQENVPERTFWRYDMETGEMTTLVFPMEETISMYYIMGDDFYVETANHLYRTDMNFTFFEDMTQKFDISAFGWTPFYRDCVYYYLDVDNGFCKYELETDETTTLYSYDGLGNIEYLAVTDEYAYYRVQYTLKERAENEVYNGDIYRLNLKSGEVELAFRFVDAFPKFSNSTVVFDIHFLTKNKVLVYAQYYYDGNPNNQVQMDGFLMDVDENGTFYNASIIEVTDLVFTEFPA